MAAGTTSPLAASSLLKGKSKALAAKPRAVEKVKGIQNQVMEPKIYPLAVAEGRAIKK